MELNLRTSQGKAYNCHVPKGATVGYLKRKLKDQFGIHEEEYHRLVSVGKALKDERALRDYHIPPGYIIYIVMK